MAKSKDKELFDDAKVELRLTHAARLAKRSGIIKHKTGAILYKADGGAIAHGWSHYSMKSFVKYPRSIHAELHAILRAPHRLDLQGAEIYIATIRSKSGNIGLGKPCDTCAILLAEVGIKRAYYTIEHNVYGTLDLTNG